MRRPSSSRKRSGAASSGRPSRSSAQIPARCHGQPWRQMDRPFGFRTSPSVPPDGDPVARGQVLERAPGRRAVLVEEAPGRGEVAGAATDVAVARLVQRVVAEHVVQVRDPLGQRGHRADVAVLQLLLDAGQLRAEGVAPVEQRPHGRHRHPLVVLAPVLRVEADRAGLHEVLGSQADQVEAPERRAVAAGPTAPHVVVGVDEHPQPVPPGAAHDLGVVVQVRLVVLARAGVLDRLPRRQQAQAVQSPAGDALQVAVDLVERRRPSDERHVGPPVDGNAEVGGARRLDRHLGRTAQVDPTEQGGPSPVVDQPAAVGGEPVGHGGAAISGR